MANKQLLKGDQKQSQDGLMELSNSEFCHWVKYKIGSSINYGGELEWVPGCTWSPRCKTMKAEEKQDVVLHCSG